MACYPISTQKFGIQVPKTVGEAYKTDQQMGTTFCMKAIEKEMDNVCVTLEVFKGVKPDQTREGKLKLGFKYVLTHMIFYIKMDGKFTCKSILGSGGHKTALLSSITYSSVVTSESVRLEFITGGMNNLDICYGDIGNSYLNAPCWENCGPKQDQNLGVRKDTFS